MGATLNGPGLRDYDRRALSEGLLQLGLTPSQTQQDDLLAHLALLRHWGATYNLVAPGDMVHLVHRHLLDSLSILPFCPEGPLLDVGTGAGFPGIPLAIMRPGNPAVLLDSAGKKIRFLRHVGRELGLKNLQTVHDRIERFSAGGDFSTITSRAFSSLHNFVNSVRHLAGPATRLLAMKARVPTEELDQLPPWAEVKDIHALEVPGLEARRNLVVLSITGHNNDEH